MKEIEHWMHENASVNAGGTLGRIIKMQEKTIDGVDYVSEFTIMLSGETEEKIYDPNDVKEIKTFE